MDASCLDYCLSEEERLEFEKNGFFAVDEVLPLQLVEKLIEKHGVTGRLSVGST